MTPDQIDRVFGRGRLKMTTGDHVEVFREAAALGERRRYTKRFLDTRDGDFGPWTEREWRILARLIGHGIGCVPDVVHFDRGARGGTRIVQTYDAGATVDQWATILPVARHGRVYRHVFEDCAHWWALAHHCVAALAAIHDLQLVHLDVKGDNVCIPVGPANFDPDDAEGCLHPQFGQLALIDFAFSLVSRETLTSALPIGWQKTYDYQSPRLLQALEAGRSGDLQPTRELDWRCDMYSLAAMLKRYLPDDDLVRAGDQVAGWTAERYRAAKGLILALRDAHDREALHSRPHQDLLAVTAAQLAATDAIASLEAGWSLARDANVVTVPALPLTPLTRLAPSVRVTASMPTRRARTVAQPPDSEATIPTHVAAFDLPTPPIIVSPRTSRVPPRVVRRRTNATSLPDARHSRGEQRGSRKWLTPMLLVLIGASFVLAVAPQFDDRLRLSFNGWDRTVDRLRNAMERAATEPANRATGERAETPPGAGSDVDEAKADATASKAKAPTGVDDPDTSQSAPPPSRTAKTPTRHAAQSPESPTKEGAQSPESPTRSSAAPPSAIESSAPAAENAPTAPAGAGNAPSVAISRDIPTPLPKTARDSMNRAPQTAASPSPAKAHSAPSAASVHRGTSSVADKYAAARAQRSARPDDTRTTAPAASKALRSTTASSSVSAKALAVPAQSPATAPSAVAAPPPSTVAAPPPSAVASNAGTSLPPALASTPSNGADKPVTHDASRAPPVLDGPNTSSTRHADGSQAREESFVPSALPATGAPSPRDTARKADPRPGLLTSLLHLAKRGGRAAPIEERVAQAPTPSARAAAPPNARDGLPSAGSARAAPGGDIASGVPLVPTVSSPPVTTSPPVTSPPVTSPPVTSPPVTSPPVIASSTPMRPAIVSSEVAPSPAPPPVSLPAGANASPPLTYADKEVVAPADFGYDDYTAQARRALANTVPRSAAYAEIEIARVLASTSGPVHTAQHRVIANAARRAWGRNVFSIDTVPATPAVARRLKDEARRALWVHRNIDEAFDLHLQALGANPLDSEVASNLASLYLQVRPAQPRMARQVVMHAMALVNAQLQPPRLQDWNTFAVASALLGREDDAARAFFVTSAIANNLSVSCRAALTAYASYGDRLRAPVEAMFQRIRDQGREDESPYCVWPPRWNAAGGFY